MFDFPTSPTEGTLFAPSGGPLYQFKSGVWTVPSTPPVMNISDTAPVNPIPGQLWWRSSDGASFVWFDDGTSKQWIQFNISNNTPDSLFLPERVSAPTTQADRGALYTKDVNGITELFYRSDNSGAEAQITKTGRIYSRVATAPINLIGLGSYDIALPPGVVGCDVYLSQAYHQNAAAQDLYIQIRNGAGALQVTNYSGSINFGGAAVASMGSGYWKLLALTTLNQVWSGIARIRSTNGAHWVCEGLLGMGSPAAANSWFGGVYVGDATNSTGLRVGFSNGIAFGNGAYLRAEYW